MEITTKQQLQQLGRHVPDHRSAVIRSEPLGALILAPAITGANVFLAHPCFSSLNALLHRWHGARHLADDITSVFPLGVNARDQHQLRIFCLNLNWNRAKGQCCHSNQSRLHQQSVVATQR